MMWLQPWMQQGLLAFAILLLVGGTWTFFHSLRLRDDALTYTQWGWLYSAGASEELHAVVESLLALAQRLDDDIPRRGVELVWVTGP